MEYITKKSVLLAIRREMVDRIENGEIISWDTMLEICRDLDDNYLTKQKQKDNQVNLTQEEMDECNRDELVSEAEGREQDIANGEL